MPFRIKLSLSILVFLVALGTFYSQHVAGHAGPKFAALFLGVFMVVAMWIFPEVTRKESNEVTRSDSKSKGGA